MIWPIFPVLFSFKSFRFNIATDLIPVDHDSWGWKAVQQLCGVGSPPSSALSSPTRCGQHGRYLHDFLGSSLMCQGTPPIQSETSTPDAFQAYNYTKPLQLPQTNTSSLFLPKTKRSCPSCLQHFVLLHQPLFYIE